LLSGTTAVVPPARSGSGQLASLEQLAAALAHEREERQMEYFRVSTRYVTWLEQRHGCRDFGRVFILHGWLSAEQDATDHKPALIQASRFMEASCPRDGARLARR
jgi:hypothetical protein